MPGMGGESKSTQTQQSQTAPWEAAQPMLQGILGQLQGNLGNTGTTGAENNAINTIEKNSANVGQFTPQINGVTANLLAGGGALNQAPALQSAYDQFAKNTSPLASNTDYNPLNTPGLRDALDSVKNDVTQSVNGMFAAAGRDGSGYNQKALASGLAQGLAPILTSQYNANVANQQGAANNLYNAGNTTGGLLTGLQQQGLTNQQAGVANVGAGLDASNAGANATLQAEAARRGIPVQALGLLAQIGIPIAGLGSQSTGTSNAQNQMSGAQQFATIMQGLGALVPKGPMSFKF